MAVKQWCQYGSPEELPSIHHRKEYDAALDRPPERVAVAQVRTAFEVIG
jgi:hypothetical protein